ncbi:hypothetical protein D3C84_739300 [compost metagenome]
MAVRHVAGDVVGIPRQPDGLLDTEQATEDLLDLTLADARVAVAVEQHGLSGDQGAFAVHMDGAPLVGQKAADTLQLQAVEDAAGQPFVQLMDRLAAPGVEAPAHPGAAQFRVADEGGAGVAAPAVIHRNGDQGDPLVTEGARLGQRGRVDHQPDRFEPDDGVDHPGEVLLHLGQGDAPAGFPQRLVVGPDHPGRGVLAPFGGHEPALCHYSLFPHIPSLIRYY